jgi:hypothetical protein
MKDDKGTDHTWNHRVILHAGADAGDDYYCIHEVHYDDGKPVGYTVDGVDVGGNSVEDLRTVLAQMTRSLEHPVLTPADFETGGGPDCEDGPDSEGFRGPRPWNGFSVHHNLKDSDNG